ncbi:MAG: hypothetical protein Q9213_005295 [Squamulea squamosa]
MAPYQYAPLNEAAKEIRLLTLLPDQSEAPICITIETTILSDEQIPDFEALSYVWGDASDRQDIFVAPEVPKRWELWRSNNTMRLDSTILSITFNLFEALKHLRYEHRSRVLWIDAISVNQQNLEERGNQVLRMPDIYRLAKRVIAWLGPESDDSAVAMNFVRSLGARITVDWVLENIAAMSQDDFDPRSKAFFTDLQLNLQISHSIRDLLSRSWFERLWVVQEICLAREKAYMVCGSEEVRHQLFSNAIFYLQAICRPKGQRLRYTVSMAYQLMKFIERPRTKLEWVLDDTRSSQCSDGRDHVYAVLSLVPEDERLGIRPDYTKSVSEVFRDMFLRQLKRSTTLRMITYCTIPNKLLHSPTWVPDWSTNSGMEAVPLALADLNTKAHAYSNSKGILAAQGVLVTEVHEVKSDLPQEIPDSDGESARVFQKLISATIGCDKAVCCLGEVTSLCRSLCMNYFPERFIPPSMGFSSLEESSRYLMDCAKWSVGSSVQPPKAGWYKSSVNRHLRGRSLVTTVDERLAVVPQATKTGDKICVLLGCRTPLVLRPDGNCSYTVVGECYLDGSMCGETLLGEMPDNWKLVSKYFPEYSSHSYVFLDRRTGETSPDDPRLGPLADGWRIKSHDMDKACNCNWYVNDITGEVAEWDPRLELDALKARGVQFQEFRLI